MRERGLTVDHVTIFCWVQRYAPEMNRRMRPYLKMSGTSYRLDETYVKVGTQWQYLYRAVDSLGCTIEFVLSARRDVSAAKRFFKKLMRADHRRLPAQALGGGSGWAMLVLDMYEHRYHIVYGAAAAKYADAFMQNVNWVEANRRFVGARKMAALV